MKKPNYSFLLSQNIAKVRSASDVLFTHPAKIEINAVLIAYSDRFLAVSKGIQHIAQIIGM
jgi:hypothetical protein